MANSKAPLPPPGLLHAEHVHVDIEESSSIKAATVVKRNRAQHARVQSYHGLKICSSLFTVIGGVIGVLLVVNPNIFDQDSNSSTGESALLMPEYICESVGLVTVFTSEKTFRFEDFPNKNDKINIEDHVDKLPGDVDDVVGVLVTLLGAGGGGGSSHQFTPETPIPKSSGGAGGYVSFTAPFVFGETKLELQIGEGGVIYSGDDDESSGDRPPKAFPDGGIGGFRSAPFKSGYGGGSTRLHYNNALGAVAGAGGGGGSPCGGDIDSSESVSSPIHGGSAGGLEGKPGGLGCHPAPSNPNGVVNSAKQGGTQTEEGIGGFGADRLTGGNSLGDSGGGGGGGFFGGGGAPSGHAAGGGGSSFVSSELGFTNIAIEGRVEVPTTPNSNGIVYPVEAAVQRFDINSGLNFIGSGRMGENGGHGAAKVNFFKCVRPEEVPLHDCSNRGMNKVVLNSNNRLFDFSRTQKQKIEIAPKELGIEEELVLGVDVKMLGAAGGGGSSHVFTAGKPDPTSTGGAGGFLSFTFPYTNKETKIEVEIGQGGAIHSGNGVISSRLDGSWPDGGKGGFRDFPFKSGYGGGSTRLYHQGNLAAVAGAGGGGGSPCAGDIDSLESVSSPINGGDAGGFEGKSGGLGCHIALNEPDGVENPAEQGGTQINPGVGGVGADQLQGGDGLGDTGGGGGGGYFGGGGAPSGHAAGGGGSSFVDTTLGFQNVQWPNDANAIAEARSASFDPKYGTGTPGGSGGDGAILIDFYTCEV